MSNPFDQFATDFQSALPPGAPGAAPPADASPYGAPPAQEPTSAYPQPVMNAPPQPAGVPGYGAPPPYGQPAPPQPAYGQPPFGGGMAPPPPAAPPASDPFSAYGQMPPSQPPQAAPEAYPPAGAAPAPPEVSTDNPFGAAVAPAGVPETPSSVPPQAGPNYSDPWGSPAGQGAPPTQAPPPPAQPPAPTGNPFGGETVSPQPQYGAEQVSPQPQYGAPPPSQPQYGAPPPPQPTLGMEQPGAPPAGPPPGPPGAPDASGALVISQPPYGQQPGMPPAAPDATGAMVPHQPPGPYGQPPTPYGQPQYGQPPAYAQYQQPPPPQPAPVDPFSVFESQTAPAPAPEPTPTAMVPAGPGAPPPPQGGAMVPAGGAPPAQDDDFWGGFGAPEPAAAADAPSQASGPSERVEEEKKGDDALPPGGEYYDARIFTPTLGVMFFKPQELTDSLFLHTDRGLVDSLGERPVVAFIVEGSSARSAGVELGHVLLKVNGVDVKNPKEASRLIKEGPRPLPLLFYVPNTDVVVAEGEHMVKYDTKDTTAPNSAKDWKPKYVVIGGIIAQPWMMNMYRSKSEYDIAVIETQARRPVSVKVKQFSLQGARIQNDWQGPQMVKYKNKLHPWKYIVILPVARNPIKISSPNLSQLKPVHEGIRRVLLAQQRGRGGGRNTGGPVRDPYANRNDGGRSGGGRPEGGDPTQYGGQGGGGGGAPSPSRDPYGSPNRGDPYGGQPGGYAQPQQQAYRY